MFAMHDGLGPSIQATPSTSATPIRRLRVLLVATISVSLTLPTLILASPASAAGGTLSVTLDAAATVRSGDQAGVTLNWECVGTGTCDGAVVSLLLPVDGDGAPLAIGNLNLDTASAGLDMSPYPADGPLVHGLLVRFPPAVNVGLSGSIGLGVYVQNSRTPDGAVLTWVSTTSTEGMATATSQVASTVRAKRSLRVNAVRSSPPVTPRLGDLVTYNVLVGYEEQFNSDPDAASYARSMASVCAEPGTQALENITVLDTLPPGAQFVSASHAGSYDSDTHTVTWVLGSSITQSHVCKASDAFAWLSEPLQVRVTFPSADFPGGTSPTAVTHTVVATANPWGQPGITLSSSDSDSHLLTTEAGTTTVAKLPSYDGAASYSRTQRPEGGLFYFEVDSDVPVTGRWTVTDFLPCGLTSQPGAGSCATPALTDLQFSADGNIGAIDVAWRTNGGTTGTCTIAAGTSKADTTKRYCGTADTSGPPIPVPAGESITRFSFEADVPALGGGNFYIHGRIAADVPTSNVDTDYTNPDLTVDRSDIHPWYVTVENCASENAFTFPGGVVMPPPNQGRSEGGDCGYLHVTTDPLDLVPAKSIYDPAVPEHLRPAVPSAHAGDTLTVDLQMRRSSWGATDDSTGDDTLTPIVTDYLPAELELIPGSLEIVAGNAASEPLAQQLGEPDVDIQARNFRGEPRQKITVTFPDAQALPGNSLDRTLFVRFQVRVKAGVPRGTYTNHYVLSAIEVGSGPYLKCSQGTMIDPDLQPTDNLVVAQGCLASADFEVVTRAELSTTKWVQGSYDPAAIPAPGVGTTDASGAARYTLQIGNSGTAAIREVVVYDLLPRIGDTLILPGASARNSAFPVHLLGPITVPAGVEVQYSTSADPCRGELDGPGGGTVASAPVGCVNDWAPTPPGDDYHAVTGVRLDFGGRVFAPGDAETVSFDARAVGPHVSGGAPDGIAWNSTALTGVEDVSGDPVTAIEGQPVGLQLLPDLTWRKNDAATGHLLGGSAWSLAPVLATGQPMPAGFPLAITDCTAVPCAGPDLDPMAGRFRVAGIRWGAYELTETVAPDGYLLRRAAVAVNVTPAEVEPTTYRVDLGAIHNTRREGKWTLTKSSIPASGSTVQPGQKVTYTVTVANPTDDPVFDIELIDDISDIVDDAKFGSISTDDGGRATRATTETIAWRVGEIAPHSARSISYTVTVLPPGQRGNHRLGNVVAPTETNHPDCTDEHVGCTEHFVAQVAAWKAVDPKSGTKVTSGQVLTYKLTFANRGKAPAKVRHTDHLADVLDDASWVGGLKASPGLKVVEQIKAKSLVITGTVPPGAISTVTYQVRVKPYQDQGNQRADNFLTVSGQQPPTQCADSDPRCTKNPTKRFNAVTEGPGGGGLLPATGASVTRAMVVAGLVLLFLGAVSLLASRRHRRGVVVDSENNVWIDELF